MPSRKNDHKRHCGCDKCRRKERKPELCCDFAPFDLPCKVVDQNAYGYAYNNTGVALTLVPGGGLTSTLGGVTVPTSTLFGLPAGSFVAIVPLPNLGARLNVDRAPGDGLRIRVPGDFQTIYTLNVGAATFTGGAGVTGATGATGAAPVLNLRAAILAVDPRGAGSAAIVPGTDKSLAIPVPALTLPATAPFAFGAAELVGDAIWSYNANTRFYLVLIASLTGLPPGATGPTGLSFVAPGPAGSTFASLSVKKVGPRTDEPLV